MSTVSNYVMICFEVYIIIIVIFNIIIFVLLWLIKCLSKYIASGIIWWSQID